MLGFTWMALRVEGKPVGVEMIKGRVRWLCLLGKERVVIGENRGTVNSSPVGSLDENGTGGIT